MEQITIRIPENTLEDVEAEAEEAGVSRSEHLRDVIESRNEHDGMHDEHEQELNELRTEVERLHREKRQILEQREENTQLVEYVEKEKDIQERRQEWMEADLVTRARWRLFGRD